MQPLVPALAVGADFLTCSADLVSSRCSGHAHGRPRIDTARHAPPRPSLHCAEKRLRLLHQPTRCLSAISWQLSCLRHDLPHGAGEWHGALDTADGQTVSSEMGTHRDPASLSGNVRRNRYHQFMPPQVTAPPPHANPESRSLPVPRCRGLAPRYAVGTRPTLEASLVSFRRLHPSSQ